MQNNDLMLETQPPHVHNPLVSRGTFDSGKFESMPPPLPPRGARGFHRNSKLSNLESAQLTGLPTVQVCR